MNRILKKYLGKYKVGWDELRKQRYKKQIESGLMKPTWKLSPRPKRIPAWDTLDEKKQELEDFRMAIYAAMVDRVDQNVGKVLDRLEEMNKRENTLIIFMSDNGACQEGRLFAHKGFHDPAWRNSKHKVEANCGEPWANASNTPFSPLQTPYLRRRGSNSFYYELAKRNQSSRRLVS